MQRHEVNDLSRNIFMTHKENILEASKSKGTTRPEEQNPVAHTVMRLV